MIYADNAATTKLSKVALERMKPFLNTLYGNPSAAHGAGRIVRDAIEEARETIARCINAEFPDEIIFTSGGTESNNQAIRSALHNMERYDFRHILTTSIEHHSVLRTVKGIVGEATYVDPDADGWIDWKRVADHIAGDTGVVSVMYASNEVGTIQPIRKIGEICYDNAVLFHTDAVQAVGHIPIDVQKDKVDYLSASAHKFHGPKGVGFLYAKRRESAYPFIVGGAQEQGRRAGTENVSGIVGMAAALDEAVRNMDKNIEHVTRLRDMLIDGLLDIPGSHLNGERDLRLPGNVNMRFDGVEGNALVLALDAHEICASAGSACTTGDLEPSHVLMAMGQTEEQAHGALRLSLSEYNTESEITEIIKAVKTEVERLRKLKGGM